MLLFKGIEYDFDAFDADDAERYEDALAQFRTEMAKADKVKSVSEQIRAQCQCIFDFFDHVLGENSHQEIFGGRTNIRTCIETAREFFALVKEQKESFAILTEEMKQDNVAAGNRAQRRAAAKK